MIAIAYLSNYGQALFTSLFPQYMIQDLFSLDLKTIYKSIGVE